MVVSEVDKVERWKQHCKDIVGTSVEDLNPLLGALHKVIIRFFSFPSSLDDHYLNIYHAN